MDKYQIEEGVCPNKKPGHGRSGSLGPRRSFRESGFGFKWWWQDSEYVRLGEDSKMAVMFGDACIYLVQTPEKKDCRKWLRMQFKLHLKQLRGLYGYIW